jgi:aerobic-type carbon monoxide dehydrogenase small subunit (CoxS/CutS family)
MGQLISLSVNGRVRQVEGPGDLPLLTALREQFGLTGAKYGCGEGQCGACTVLLNGRAVRSCLTAVKAAAGKTIRTIEGLEQDGKLHPLQEAFLATGAMQCGYCTPGMILSGVALLERTPSPGEAEIKHALEGNLCRCGTYPRIVEAVRLAAQAGVRR